MAGKQRPKSRRKEWKREPLGVSVSAPAAPTAREREEPSCAFAAVRTTRGGGAGPTEAEAGQATRDALLSPRSN